MSSPKKIDRRDFLKGLAGATVAGALAGCAKTPTEAPTAEPTKAAATAAPTKAAVATPTAAPVIKYKDKACIHHYMTGGYAGPGTEDDLIKQVQEEALRNEYGLNVDIQIESATWADFDQLLNIRLETQATDSVERNPSRILRWMAQPGLIADMDDEIKEYGKNLLELMSPASFAYFMRGDGKYVGIPWPKLTPTDVEFITIRRDWCDKIDRDVPQTIEDLEECLRLFKEKKLGGEITIPLAPMSPNWPPGALLKGPYVPSPEEQFKMMERGENVETGYGLIMREERLALLQKWYRDGLLNPEWASWKSDDANSAIDKGMVGCAMGGWWDANSFYQRVEKEIDPSQDWVQIFPPPGLKDVPHTGRVSAYSSIGRALVVTTWANCPEAIVALCDWQNKSLENFRICTWGIEGRHWKLGEGGWYENLRSPAPNQEYNGLRRTPHLNKWDVENNLLPPMPGNEPKNPLIPKRVYKNAFSRTDTTVPEQGEYPQILPIDLWNPYMFTESAQYGADFEALRTEYFTNIVKGEKEVVAGIKEFWDRWMAAGGEVRLKEISEQDPKYIQAHPEMKDPYIFCAKDHWNTKIEYPPRPQR